MEQLIKTILSNNGFSYNDQIEGYELPEKSYFFIQTIGIDQLEEIKSKNSLKDCTWYQNFLSSFNQTCNKAEYSAVEKNSSLLILVEGTSIQNLLLFQSQILLIEEDQFFVKKYVFIYTKTAVSKISPSITNNNLQDLVKDSNSFKIFRDHGAIDDINNYVVILQLFIKLPFLKLKFENNDFIGLEEKLRTSLTKDFTLYNQLTESHESLKIIDFLSDESDAAIDTLTMLLSHDKN